MRPRRKMKIWSPEDKHKIQLTHFNNPDNFHCYSSPLLPSSEVVHFKQKKPKKKSNLSETT